MKVYEGFESEYKKRHDAIWPELSALLNQAGVTDYSIFLDKQTRTLFAVHTIAEGFDPDYLPKHPIVKKWWQYMADIMETNDDNSPVTTSLDEVFYLE